MQKAWGSRRGKAGLESGLGERRKRGRKAEGERDGRLLKCSSSELGKEPARSMQKGFLGAGLRISVQLGRVKRLGRTRPQTESKAGSDQGQ